MALLVDKMADIARGEAECYILASRPSAAECFILRIAHGIANLGMFFFIFVACYW